MAGVLTPDRVSSYPVTLSVRWAGDYDGRVRYAATDADWGLTDVRDTAEALRQLLSTSLLLAQVTGHDYELQQQTDYAVEAIRMESDLLILLGLPAFFARPKYLKSLLALAREAWNLPVAVRRDRAVLNKEIAEAEADRAHAELREKEATANALRIASQMVPYLGSGDPRPESAELVVHPSAEQADMSSN